MHLAQMLTRKSTLVLTASVLVLLLGSGLAYATEQKVFHSSYEFPVYDPAEPVVQTSVNGTFINHDISIMVNLSSHDGVKELNGTYSIVVEIWNDTANAYQPFQTLVSADKITLTPAPTTLTYAFTTDTPATYNVDVEFTTTSVVLA